jgi:hypothetical protein
MSVQSEFLSLRANLSQPERGRALIVKFWAFDLQGEFLKLWAELVPKLRRVAQGDLHLGCAALRHPK